MWMEARLKPQSFPQEHVGLGVDALIPKPRQNSLFTHQSSFPVISELTMQMELLISLCTTVF